MRRMRRGEGGWKEGYLEEGEGGRGKEEGSGGGELKRP